MIPIKDNYFFILMKLLISLLHCKFSHSHSNSKTKMRVTSLGNLVDDPSVSLKLDPNHIIKTVYGNGQ